MPLTPELEAYGRQVRETYETFEDEYRECFEYRRIQKVRFEGDEIFLQHTGCNDFGGKFQIHYARKSELPSDVWDFFVNDDTPVDRCHIYTRLTSILWVEPTEKDRRMLVERKKAGEAEEDGEGNPEPTESPEP